MDIKKIALLLVLVIIGLFWFYQRDTKIENATVVEEQKEQTRKTEQAEPEELEKSENDADSEISSLIHHFFKAQYDYSNPADRYENLKPYVTVELLNMFGSSDTGESPISVISKVDSIIIYQLDEKEAVVRVISTYQVQESTPIHNDMLVELKFEQDLTGDFLVSKQAVYNVQGTE